MLLADKNVWITGASRGIGQATAIEAAKNGARVILSARSEQGLRDTASQVRSFSSVEPEIVAFDVTDTQAIKEAFKQVFAKLKRLDVLVNNAGVLKDSLIGMIDESQVDEVMRTNAHSVIHLMQGAARLMMRQHAGSIVNVSSILARTGNEGSLAYAASKAAIIGATKSAARELAPRGIRVNAVAPGVIKTEMIAHVPPAKMEERERAIKMGRLGEPEEVARVIVFLASDLASYVTGQIVGVDGGMCI
jgi:3-oxoacyl-[acyl-carrier protein] reductase